MQCAGVVGIVPDRNFGQVLGGIVERRAVQVFWGDRPQMQSEQDFLEQLEGDLRSSGMRAVILANFYTRSGSRQVDFVVATETHVCHVELKNYERVLLGSLNGPWHSRRADGAVDVIDRQNPYDQARSCKMAISDDMGSLAKCDARIPRPADGSKFFTQFDSVVCIYPRLAEGSDVPSDYKVRTLGYREFFSFLASPGKHPGWNLPHWEAFIRDLGLVNAADEDAGVVRETKAGALAREYRQRFDAFHHNGLHELVPLLVLLDGEAMASADLCGILQSAGHLQFIGMSGSGKSHLLVHSLLSTDDSVLPIIVDGGMYEGRLSSLLDRSVARFTTSGSRELLRAAAINGQSVVLAVDGFNECPERLRDVLVSDMSAFCLRTGASTVITTQAKVGFPPGLTGAEAYAAGLSDADRLAVLTSYDAGDILSLCGPFTTPYELSIAAECAAELHGPITRGALFASFIRRRLSRAHRPAAVRDALRQVAWEMDQRLTTWLPLDDVWRIIEEHLARHGAPVGVVDEALTCSLTRTSQGRLSFTHEFLGRFLVLEALRRDHPDPISLAKELRLPRHGDLPQMAAELEANRARLTVLLNGLADKQVYAAALRGEVGRLAEKAATNTASELLAKVTSGMVTTTFTIHNQWQATITGGYSLDPADHALLAAIGTLTQTGQFAREVGRLLDATDEACRRSADEQQRAEGRRPGMSLIVSAVLCPTFASPGRTRAAASLLLAATQTAWPMGRIHRPSGQPEVDIRVIFAFLDGTTPQSHGRLFLLCYLLTAAGGLEAAALVPQVLRLCWASRAYHIKLDSLAMVRSFAAEVEGQPIREQIIDALSEIDTDNWGLSTMLAEALNAYGLIESPYDEEFVRSQVDQALGSPADQESRELAYSIVERQFEDLISDSYISVVRDLEPGRRTMLYVLASLGAPHYGFWTDWLLEQLIESHDSRALPAYKRWACAINASTQNPQEAARCYALAIQGWAQLMPDPPERGEIDGDAHAAWQSYGAIMFWLHRTGMAPAETAVKCTPHWQSLRGGLLPAAADPLYWLHTMSQFYERDSPSPLQLMMLGFPDEIRLILEWSIQHPSDLTSVFPHVWEDRQRTLIALLAKVGNAESSELLQSYVDDSALGATAIIAIRYLANGENPGDPGFAADL